MTTDSTSTPTATASTTEKPTLADTSRDRLLAENFKPGENEVIIGRGKKVTGHSGNRRFQELVREELFNYSKAPSKTEKSFILAKILHQVRRWSKERIGFVKQDPKTKRWCAPRDSVARVTVAQAFRDALSNRYSSSKHNKQRKRQIAKGYVTVEEEVEESPAVLMQPPALSLKSVVHQGMRKAAFNAPAAATPQETMAQIRALVASNNSWSNVPFPNNANPMAMMQMMPNPACMDMQMTHNSAQHFHMHMNAAAVGAGMHPMMPQMPPMTLSQQIPPISDLEPLPINEENPFQAAQQQMAANAAQKPDDAFLASEQTSAFFLGAGNSFSMQ